jgi:hypothetical protein
MSINKVVKSVSSSQVRAVVPLVLLTMLSGCFSTPKPAEPVAQPLPVVDPNPFGPVVGEDGRCKGSPQIDLMALKARNTDAGLVGVSECELVALKGEPLSVQSGSSPSAKRETTILYMEATGKAVYLFANNQMVRVVRGNAQ